MEAGNRRRFLRVDMQRDVQLDFGRKRYACSISNLSLSGLYVQGETQQQPGDACTISLRRSECDAEEIIARGAVVRVGGDGMALRFTSMGVDSFLFLQNTLLYESNDPKVLGCESVCYRLL